MAKVKYYNWLTQNSKLKKSSGIKTYNWGIPAYKSSTGFKTCPLADICAKGCYATMGAYTFSNVAQVFENRLALSRSDTFVQVMDNEIKRRKIVKVCIHDSSDFYNAKYLDKWIKIMHINPNTEFYAYTKMVSLFNKYQVLNKLSNNFTVIYSYGGLQDYMINTNKDRHAFVFETVEQLLACGYADASKDDNIALGSNIKIGLVYHGTKNFSNTDWDK